MIMLRRIWPCVGLVAPLLAGCSLSPVISHQTLDYFKANDLASNQIILLNILRAKDGAPLHFSELSQIRGQLSVGTTDSATIPFGSVGVATTKPRNLASIGISVSTAPSFDIASLDTKDFTDGVMTPITPRTAEFFLDEGIDYRMVLMLLVSGIRPAGAEEMLLNAPDSARMVCYTKRESANAPPVLFSIVAGSANCPVQPELEYFTFLRVINNLNRLYPVSVKLPGRLVGPPFALNIGQNLRAVTGIDPSKYSLGEVRSGPDKGKFQLMASSHENTIVLCEAAPGGPRPVSALTAGDGGDVRVPDDACDPSRGATDDDDADAGPAASRGETVIGEAPGTFVLKLRSTLEVIQYVGQIVALQQRETYDNPAGNPRQLPQCITLEPEEREAGAARPTCGRGGELFNLRTGPRLFDTDAVSVDYDGSRWALPPPPTCGDGDLDDCAYPDRYDHTLETMSIISLLLNQNKSAADIARTPAVQSVP
jgi:hypothetical protein